MAFCIIFMEHSSQDEIPENGSPQQDATPESGETERTSLLDLPKLRRLRKGLRLTQAELAALLGIHRTYLVLIEKGKKIPSPRLERAIFDFMERAERQTLSPQTLWADATAPRFSPFTLDQPAAKKTPVVSWAAAGTARAYEDLANQIEENVETDCKDPNSFAVIIEGDSMEPKFFAGDRIIFAPNLEPRNGDAVIAKLTDGRVYFKYFFRTGPEGSKIKLVSENANYNPMEFDRGELAFVYPAWEVKRRLRK
jgi:SOS-response transcriptional repressor LexA